MHPLRKAYNCHLFLFSLLGLLLMLHSCRSAKHVPQGSYLLKSNTVRLSSDRTITNKGVLQDQLNLLVVQKTNTYWSGIIPFKLWKYNFRAQKYLKNPDLELPKSIEAPVLYDSALRERSAANMRNFLLNQGYFKAIVSDTVRLKNKTAKVEYSVITGVNYLIDQITIESNNPEIQRIAKEGLGKTVLKKELPYTKPLIDEERSRIIGLMQNNGYYKFGQDNISFELDTFNKEKFRNSESLFESAINLVTLQKNKKKYSVDIKVMINDSLSPDSYSKFKIGKMIVFPDFTERSLALDSSMIVEVQDGITFRYHKYYVRSSVLNKQIFIRPGDVYSRKNHELSITKLNELGIFQMVNVYFVEDTLNKQERLLNCYITLSPGKSKDATGTIEVANAVTYWLGNSLGAVYRNKNFMKGANLLSISATGGVEMNYFDSLGKTVWDKLQLQSTNFSLNSSLVFPKFLTPFTPKWIDRRNLPRTQLLLGLSVLDRIELFRLANIFSSFAYNWRKTQTQIWDFAPAFANIVLPTIRPDFQRRLDSNAFLRNSYRRTFIQGEQFAITFSDQEKKQNRNFTYLRVGVEEAGLIVSGINEIHKATTKSEGILFDQYLKFDVDARRYFNAKHSMLALRFLAGVGNPYGASKTLPYIKQYFVGGPYSIRGWRPRTLGPRGLNTDDSRNLDITGDIKLEMNAEYRFDMIQLFSGTLNLNGAVFADAGNIWLAQKDETIPNGHFEISRLGHDIAVSTGAGLRVIVAGFFTVRLDAAFPIKNPYVQPNNGWILRQVELGNRAWRSDNVVLNVAIGMPF